MSWIRSVHSFLSAQTRRLSSFIIRPVLERLWAAQAQNTNQTNHHTLIMTEVENKLFCKYTFMKAKLFACTELQTSFIFCKYSFVCYAKVYNKINFW